MGETCSQAKAAIYLIAFTGLYFALDLVNRLTGKTNNFLLGFIALFGGAALAIYAGRRIIAFFDDCHLEKNGKTLHRFVDVFDLGCYVIFIIVILILASYGGDALGTSPP
jgi:hypothetical protein